MVGFVATETTEVHDLGDRRKLSGLQLRGFGRVVASNRIGFRKERTRWRWRLSIELQAVWWFRGILLLCSVITVFLEGMRSIVWGRLLRIRIGWIVRIAAFFFSRRLLLLLFSIAVPVALGDSLRLRSREMAIEIFAIAEVDLFPETISPAARLWPLR